MNLQEIKSAIASGKKVCWVHEGYEVRKAGDEYYILCLQNEHCIGLTHQDEITMNGAPEQFYIP